MEVAPKLAVVVEEDLAPWQKLNVTAFVVSGLAATDTDLIGEPYVDGSGATYFPDVRLSADYSHRTICKGEARFPSDSGAGLRSTVYTRELFATGNDVDNRAAVALVAMTDLDVVGFAVTGTPRLVDKALEGLSLHS